MTGVKIGVVSLGCSKNRVDTELMLGELHKEGYVFTPLAEDADVILVNTCGFIESAKRESIDAILEMAEHKKTGSLKALIVTGCLSERYREELQKELPEVDAFLGVTAHGKIAQAVREVLEGKRAFHFGAPQVAGDYGNRMLTTPSSYAYVKIAEGCNNRCSYCAIPSIRGNLVSRSVEDIKEEVSVLLSRGIHEVVLVAQDTSKYGADLYGAPRICELIDELTPLSGLKCLRLLYCYPDGVTDRLLQTMLRHDNVAKYLDIPIQHVDDAILKSMRRRDTRSSVYEAVEKIRAASEEFILRTTLITGYPGETEEQFQTLKQGVADLQFDRLGVFAYSREEGTPAYSLPNQVPERVKEKRRDEIMLLQQGISLARNKTRVGRVYSVVIEEKGEEEHLYFGRSYGEAPEIDGRIGVYSEKELTRYGYYDVQITDADIYELRGRTIEK